MKNILLALFISAAELSAASQEMIVIGLGGFNTCGSDGLTTMNLYGPFMQLTQNLKEDQRTIHYVVGCLKGNAPPNGQGFFVSSRSPNQTVTGNTFDVQKEIEALSKEHPDAPLYIVGHSYGGWMAMYLTLKLTATIPVRGLFSIDPISPLCGPLQVVTGNAVCKQAPKELDNLAIQKRVGHWLNFYQDQDSFLHSSGINEAENHYFQYRGPHSQIDYDSRTWDAIQKLLKTE